MPIKCYNSLIILSGQGTPYYGLYVDAPTEWGTFYKLQIYKRVGTSQDYIYERVRKSLF